MDFLQKIEDRILWIALGLGLALLALAVYVVVSSFPPREFTILTGRQGGGYYQAAEAYQKLAAERGFTINIRETSGSVETLKLLEEGEAGIGFVQGGVAIDADPQVLSTLSSVFYEPLWVFYRNDVTEALTDPTDLASLRIGIGETGSGTNQFARQFLWVNGITDETATLLDLNTSDTAAGLVDGSVDAGLFVVAPTSQTIQDLLRNEDLSLLSIDRAEAYRSKFPFLTSVVLPAGIHRSRQQHSTRRCQIGLVRGQCHRSQRLPSGPDPTHDYRHCRDARKGWSVRTAV